MQKLNEAQIDTAVKWWSDAIANIKFDNGDDTQQGVMASMMAKLANGATPAQSERGILFAKHLRTLLERGINGWCLSVDYHPEGELADAAELAGIETGNLTSWPWKTVMWFERGGVQVRAGYGAAVQTLLADQD